MERRARRDRPTITDIEPMRPIIAGTRDACPYLFKLCPLLKIPFAVFVGSAALKPRLDFERGYYAFRLSLLYAKHFRQFRCSEATIA